MEVDTTTTTANLLSLGPEAWDDSELLDAFEDALRSYGEAHVHLQSSGNGHVEGADEERAQGGGGGEREEEEGEDRQSARGDAGVSANGAVHMQDTVCEDVQEEVTTRETDIETRGDDRGDVCHNRVDACVSPLSSPPPPQRPAMTMHEEETASGRGVYVSGASLEELAAASEAARALASVAPADDIQALLHAWYYAGFYAGRHHECERHRRGGGSAAEAVSSRSDPRVAAPRQATSSSVLDTYETTERVTYTASDEFLHLLAGGRERRARRREEEEEREKEERETEKRRIENARMIEQRKMDEQRTEDVAQLEDALNAQYNSLRDKDKYVPWPQVPLRL